MPLNQNDEVIPSEADKTTDLLVFKEVGGVKQLIYHPFRFNKYELDIDKSNDYWVGTVYLYSGNANKQF